MNTLHVSSLAAFFRKVQCPCCKRYQSLKGKAKDGFKCKYCGTIIEPPKDYPKA